MIRRLPIAFVIAFQVFGNGPAGAGEGAAAKGERMYQALCVECHGKQGEGVAGKYDETLYGTRTLESLTRYIDRAMPEDDPDKCVGEDAAAVAEYIYNAFYSQEARARLSPARVELVRLTNRQYRESVADLVGSFGPRGNPPATFGGLKADYYQSEGMNKKAKKALSRQDATVAFDFGNGSPVEGVQPEQYSIAWQGSLHAPDTGFYELRLKTPNGARLYVNADLKAGDANTRDDSDARRQDALLDLWVSSGEMREASTRLFLIGGRSYPLRLDYFKYKETNASVHLAWKPPHGQWEVIPGRYLSSEVAPVVTLASAPFPPDDSSLGYERGSAVSKAWHEAAVKSAIEVANQVVARLNRLAGASDKDENRKERLMDFAGKLAERAFGRPLSPELRAEYVDEHFSAGVPDEIAVKRSVLMVLTSPRFLFPGIGAPLDSYTVATRLSLALWDSLPDEALLEAAKDGKLMDAAAVREQAERMISDPRARTKLREFFHHWLRMDDTENLTKDTKAYPGFDEQMVADLRESLEKFIERVVWSEQSDYRELLKADYLFLNSRLARFYGHEGRGEDGFELVQDTEGHRAGVFTHPYILSSLSYYRSSSPIHRGVFLTRNILGRFLKPPPMAISFMDDRFDPSLTMREKVTELTKSETCMGCHVTINPLGFSLENFDATGRWRTTDNKKPVDPESDYVGSDGKTIRLRGPREVAEHAVTNPDARIGFVRQLFHHMVKQSAVAYGPDTLQLLDTRFEESGCHIRKLCVEIATRAAIHGRDSGARSKNQESKS